MSRQCLRDLREAFSLLASVRAQAAPRKCKVGAEGEVVAHAYLVTEEEDARLCQLGELVWLMWAGPSPLVEVIWHGTSSVHVVGFPRGGLAVMFPETEVTPELVEARRVLRDFSERRLPELFADARSGWREMAWREAARAALQEKTVTGHVAGQVLGRCGKTHKVYAKEARAGMKFDVFWAVFLARSGFPLGKAAFGRISGTLYFIAVRRDYVRNFLSCTRLKVVAGD